VAAFDGFVLLLRRVNLHVNADHHVNANADATMYACTISNNRSSGEPASKPHTNSVPLQFGRDVAARLLMMPDRAHWKACVLNKAEETELTSAFGNAFAPFNPHTESEE
jgi:Protein similar to CwfJ C-terminus 2